VEQKVLKTWAPNRFHHHFHHHFHHRCHLGRADDEEDGYRFHADTAPVAPATIDETLDRKEFSSVDDVQLQADRPVAGISDVCPAGVGRSLPKEGRLQD
jgi:hypothetical protein